MMSVPLPASAAHLFSHVAADKAAVYRAVMNVFATAKRQFRLHLRPDEILADTATLGDAVQSLEALQAALDQLTEWGNLEAQADTSRVATLEDYYKRRLLYRMTAGGEAVEAALQTFVETIGRRAELQSVALDDILARLVSLDALGREEPRDAAKIHAALRDLVHVFDGLASNAEAFIAGLERTVELQRAEAAAVLAFKSRLIDYLQRFIGDLVTRSGQIGEALRVLAPHEHALLSAAAEREARDAAPGDPPPQTATRSTETHGVADLDESVAAAHLGASRNEAAVALRLASWFERWNGLKRWFVAAHGLSQAELLRRSALEAIPRLLQAVSLLNERRSGRSDRAADFRRLALWFADAPSDAAAHRLWRAAFALSPARHLALAAESDVSASTSWRDAPPIVLHPLLRERGVLPTRGAPPKIRDRSLDRERLAARMAHEAVQTERARRRLATGRETRLSELGTLDRHAFGFFLSLLGEALAAQVDAERPVERLTMDGTLRVRLEPLDAASRAEIETDLGRFAGRDHRLTITSVSE
jgi:uncharacterized protein (TIGR02677 family)